MRDLPADDAWIADRRQAVGAAIREARRIRNVTQDQVWMAARISRWTLQRAEAGDEVTLSTLLRIARVLEIPLADLVR
ncbi:helix-turn-helix domain-containing protein [Streptomyces sp. LNU-CPARS28]|uniref:helix-turn-helix domain-containing protein n=1 Tax=Streptomyces sp. LNU-CPARS28 TaxID=3137371 RepID=UPI00313669FB